MTDRPFNVEQLEVERGERVLIAGLSFGLEAGRLALVVGPNGAGKTTLLRVLAGLAPPAAGVVEWRGCEVRRLAPEQRAEIMYRGHFDGLKKDLTVRENLELYRALHGGGIEVDEILEPLGLVHVAERQIRYLSAGQRRRTGLAALRAGRAALWLLDEPMTNLDANGREVVGEWLRGHLRAGGTAVVATHRPDELAGADGLMIEL